MKYKAACEECGWRITAHAPKAELKAYLVAGDHSKETGHSTAVWRDLSADELRDASGLR